MRKQTKEEKNESRHELFDQPLRDFLPRMKIDRWDWLLVGDGSGSNWKFECGWAATTIDHATDDRREWWGGMNRGTNNVAEFMAYLQPLSYILQEEERRQKGAPRKMRHVHIFTDSDYVAKTNEEGRSQLKKNNVLFLWASDFARQGLLLNWYYIRRETLALNHRADLISKKARKLLVGNDLPTLVTRETGQDVYRCNP